MNFFNKQRIRLLSLITFGQVKQHYRTKWSAIKRRKNEIEEEFERMGHLIEDQVNDVKKYVSWRRVPGFSKPLPVKDAIDFSIQAMNLHQKFMPVFQGVNNGKDLVVVATGPSLKKYKRIFNVKHLGVNQSYKKEDLEFDYLFAQDSVLQAPYIDEIIDYRNEKCQKFVIAYMALRRVQPKYVYRFIGEDKWNYDLDFLPFPDFSSVIFSAMAFALWTRPRRIFIVGADCSKGHAVKCAYEGDASNLILPWKGLKKFAESYYPEVKLISVNPVGLKGVFMDMYEIEVILHNVPPHQTGDLCITMLNDEIGFFVGGDKHVDSEKDDITGMGRAYTAMVKNESEKVHFCLSVKNEKNYFAGIPINGCIELDYVKDEVIKND